MFERACNVDFDGDDSSLNSCSRAESMADDVVYAEETVVYSYVVYQRVHDVAN